MLVKDGHSEVQEHLRVNECDLFIFHLMYSILIMLIFHARTFTFFLSFSLLNGLNQGQAIRLAMKRERDKISSTILK